MLKCNMERLEEKILCYSKFGDTGNGGITRLCLSDADIQGRKEFIRRTKELGADIKIDDMGNIYATLEGSDNSLPAIVMGSHADSVVNGGNYDGILGVLTGLEVAETIVKENIPHKHPITIMIWTNEEGARFDPAMMSSGVICGKFKKEDMLASSDIEGVTFGEALAESEFCGNIENRLDPKKCLGMLELHIEQGPVLEQHGVDIGVLEGEVGMVNYEFEFKGQAGHAGTVPMPWRKDALFAAAKALDYLHSELDKLDSKLVYTTGRILCHPNVHTIVPDNVKLTLDARHQDPEVIKQVVKVVENIPKELAKCNVSYKELWARNTVNFNKELVDAVQKSVDALGYSNMRMYSGPGHDAQYVADIMPTTMIFVPSDGGHSHCEIEHTSIENCWKGSNVLLNTVLELDKK